MNVSPVHLILLGSMMFVIGFVLWRNTVLRRQSSRRRPHREAVAEIETRMQIPDSHLRGLEVRLHDYDREVEARIKTTLAILDKLVLDATQESAHLEELIDRAQALGVGPKLFNPNAGTEMSAEQQRRFEELVALGLADDEIARVLQVSEEVVACSREIRRSTGRDAA